MSKLKSFIFIFLCLFFVTCLEVNEDVTIDLFHLNSKQTGKKGTVAVHAIPYDKFSEDTSRKIYFHTKITDGTNTFDVDCGFSKPGKYSFFVFCNLNTNIPAGNYSIDFTGIPKFDYQSHSISFTSKEKFEFEKLDKDYINLYSDKQTINIVDGKNSYELKFNIESYNQETVMLGNEPMDCKQENNELICQIKKDELEKDLLNEEEERTVKYFSDVDRQGGVQLPLVGEIIIKDNITQKTDVFIGITKLIQNISEGESLIAYETNITNIDKVMGKIELDFENEKTGSTFSGGCLIGKHEINPLLITCFMENDGINHLKEIKEEIQFKNAHLKYNFRIQPVKNEEKIYFSEQGKGSWITWLYPKVLDFTKNASLYIYYETERSESLSSLIGMSLNEEKEDLSCEIRENDLLRCTVPVSHFEGKKSGYYITKHTNHMNSKSTFYESSPIKVILTNPEPKPTPSKGSIHSISLYYLLLLFVIML